MPTRIDATFQNAQSITLDAFTPPAGAATPFKDATIRVGKDAFRYTMLRFSLDAPIEFDVEAVTRQSMDNPVYYVQYAHARISSVLRNAADLGVASSLDPPTPGDVDVAQLAHERENDLLRAIGKRPGETVTVVKLHGQGAVKRRIMDMGITKGVEVFVRKVAPLGDPIEVNIRGYELSLRKSDAEMVEVQ